jgi:hypothetical protein
LYIGETQIAELVDLAEQATDAQLGTVFAAPRDHHAEFSWVFSVKLKQLMQEFCGGDLEAPRGR